MERIDKTLAHALSISRAEVQRLIRAKRIVVNNNFVKSASEKISEQDVVLLDDNIINIPRSKRYFMLNKPEGYVCANADSTHPSITTLLDEPSAYLLHSAGRLDVDTTGLVLLTDDGEWSHKITSPKKKCPKQYLVTVKAPLDNALIDMFRAGLQLNQEKALTAPADLIILDEYTATITIHEGKYHQVKRMFAAVNNRVIQLKRLQIGQLCLDNSLEEGEYRALTEEEINLFL